MGNTVHRTLPGTRGAAPRGGAERSVLPGQPQPWSPGYTRESGCLSLIPIAAPLPGRADPRLVLLALAVRPSPLFQPEVAEERAAGHRGFPRPEPPGGLRGTGVPGPRAQPAGAPTTRATSWLRSHARRAAPSSGVRSAGGSEPLLRSASPPS